ncbi:BTAD domain-containing putative transcriptional regulator [Amycolatopsis sp. 195334CR]|uniref:AfsR/SARP family transcriptional regulator n=1 Tax=Amycolatopsis sp. 195334CR TaxID=2814588 RepID=UPI001A8DB52A|nr:BTAD domain-containing putative transcriptional regulator [Amycolatopsis sp. 195334CR]MBN6039646.1 winged helix-turn-helix domain-containing protein [Amycolatopsis sp. 195334CR]
MTGLRFAVLGPVRAWHRDRPLDLGPVRQQALLAALLLRPGVTFGKRELLDRVWGDEPPGTGVKVVPGYVFRLRRGLAAAGVDADAVITSDRGGYRFAADGIALDSVRLEEIAAEGAEAGRAGELATAVELYSTALGLFGGEPLDGLPGPFADGERRRLTERRIVLSQEKVDWQLRLGLYTEAIDELSVLSAAHPRNETLAGLLMRAYYAGGRRADALEVFARLRHRLVDELGMEPDAEVQQVHQAILRGDDALLGVAARREEPVVRRARFELPLGAGELAGRDRELAVLTAPAADGAVTVAAVDGVAGSGKTALVVRAARELREQCPDGCLFIDLHGHSDDRTAPPSSRVLRRLLRAVGVDDNETMDDLDELAASWRAATASLRLLLVLDDASGAEQVRPLLPAGPGSRVLVTSRRRLSGLDAAHRVSLGPLGLDQAQDLLNRIVGGARAGREQEAVREVARLCGRLPLALRIAGARLQNRPMWTFEYLVSRLADDGSRLGELTAEDRSVEAAFRLSYEQLADFEQRAFRMLGLSPTPELDRLVLAALLGSPAAEAEHALESLVDTSLLQQPAPGRYRLHDLVAVYARRLAAEEPAEVVEAARTAVVDLYIGAGRHASECGLAGFPTGPELDGGPFTGWRDATAWLDQAGDLRDVVAYAVAVGGVDRACWLAESLVDYLIRLSRYDECRAAVHLVLPLASRAADRRMPSAVRLYLGFAHAMPGYYEQARDWFTEALRISEHAGAGRETARALTGIATLDVLDGRYEEPMGLLTRSLAMATEHEDDWLAERAISTLGYLHHLGGRHEEALGYFARSRVLGEKIGNPAMVGRTLYYSGSVHLVMGHFAEAARFLRLGAEAAKDVSDGRLYASCLTRLATAELQMGNLETALELQQRAFGELTEQIAYTALTNEVHEGLATTRRAIERRDRRLQAAGGPA